MEECDELEDPFNQHFHYDLSPELLSAVSKKQFQTVKNCWPCLKQFIVKLPHTEETGDKSVKTIDETMTYVKPPYPPKNIQSANLKYFYIKSQIADNVLNSNLTHTGEKSLTALQLELLSIICDYRDLYFTERTFSNADQIRFVYSLHAINHVLKTRLKVIHHNARISNKSEVSDEFRDQGLVRPKVLIVVPFKNSAFKIIKMISSILLTDDKQNIVNKKRFLDEFSGDHVSFSQKKTKPEDFEKTFEGNTNDDFKIGIAVTKKSLKLYADFYSSDIIVASPLSLRMIIGVEGEIERDYDFLSSIELLILDQTELFLMQNWDHILHIMDHLNLQPKQAHGTDFARVRSWAINGWTKYYRQNLVFCSHSLVEISALVSQKCYNYAGCVRTNNQVAVGTISQVIVCVHQIFYRLPEKSATEIVDERFNLFIRRILPQCQDNVMKHVLIYIPSYFDFVRISNHFRSEAISCVQVTEYMKSGKVAQARDKFFHNQVNYMLYSERFHFFNRRIIRGIRHLIFYQLPTFPHFYSEMCNFMQDANQNPKSIENCGMSISVIYSKYDAPQLAAIVSTKRAARMLSADNDVHMFMTDD